jgi:hypothetical protein
VTDQPQGAALTAAHGETETFRLVYYYPAHEPRASDPHYGLFNAARRRLERLGALRCWIANADCSGGPIELHHAHVEFALANIVDVAKFAADYPELHVTDDATFLDFVESEGNLTPLCAMHHRGMLGIHTIHYPAWVLQRVMKDGVTAPERKAP